MERMEEKMKGTDAENSLAKMFVGKMKTYLSCINVDYESSRVEDFWDIQLNVSGNKNLDDSFRDYIQVETLDGENKYSAEGHGLQDAKKGVIFESFPQVLHMQLKRFEYDINRDAMMKVNDRYEFPETFDATPYLADSADKSESYIYKLHGVLVHSGDFNAGHYYAFLKPTKDGHFYKFDDDRVTIATMKEVLEENFGGDYPIKPSTLNNRFANRNTPIKRSMSAYMLVYIRESRLDSILFDVTKSDTPPHLQKKLDEERAQREAKRKEREEAHLYLPVKVISERSFKDYQGFDLMPTDSEAVAPGEETPGAHKLYKTLRTTTIGELKEFVGKDLGLKAGQVRIWVMVNRQNKTTRPDNPIQDDDMSIEEAYQKWGTKSTKEFCLWAETRELADGDWPMHSSFHGAQSPPIMVFTKYFDTEAQTLRGAGTIYMRRQDKVVDMTVPISQLMGWPSTTSLDFFEVWSITIQWRCILTVNRRSSQP
jgi:ubiquitin carboxyl-terminal hydrolase 7